MKNIRKLSALLALLLALCLLFCGCDEFLGELGIDLGDFNLGGLEDIFGGDKNENISLSNIPAYSGDAYVAVNNNLPFFTAEEIKSECYEYYSSLDKLGRCGVVHACLGTETMPPKDDERGSISSVKPSGWVQKKYDTKLVDGGYLYNRAHLIGWQLSDEDANEKNLITGTRYFNVEGMLPFENMVAAHLREDGGHVMYRVTPIYEGNNLVANGVLMEAYSVEDGGESISFCVYVYNVQPGVIIDYATGESRRAEG